MNTTVLCPPNLRALGWVRQQEPEADIKTILRIPEYPVIGNYKKVCAATGLAVFGGGTIEKQGDLPGKITSGFRDAILGGNNVSPHHFGFALDIAVGDIFEQIRIADAARGYFSRVGLYVGNGFIHLDLAPDAWIDRYLKSQAWVKYEGNYRPFNDWAEAIQYAESCAA